jgi:hypothetical protein
MAAVTAAWRWKMKGIIGWAALLALPLSAHAASLAVVCSVDAPVVGPHENVRANVYALGPEGESLRYTWKASGGSLEQTNKAEVEWTPNGAASGTFTLSAEVTGSAGDTGACSVAVIAGSSDRSVEPAGSGFTRQIRSAMLIKGKPEEEHFGLYSYMLLGAPVNDSNRERYSIFLNSFLNEVLHYDRLNKEFAPQYLNIAYLPVRNDLPVSFKVDWVLSHYDYERAQGLMSRFTELHGEGPFIISVAQPLSRLRQFSDPKPRLIEDLSTVPVSVVEFWVKQFLVQTAQDKWDSATLSGLALRVRTAIEVAAIGSKEVRASLSGLFKQ